MNCNPHWIELIKATQTVVNMNSLAPDTVKRWHPTHFGLVSGCINEDEELAKTRFNQSGSAAHISHSHSHRNDNCKVLLLEILLEVKGCCL